MYWLLCNHFKWLMVIVDGDVSAVDVCVESF